MAPLTYEWYCPFLDSFTALYCQLKVKDLKPYHVTRWLEQATDELVNGVDPVTAATPMGHRNQKMLMETYQKLQPGR